MTEGMSPPHWRRTYLDAFALTEVHQVRCFIEQVHSWALIDVDFATVELCAITQWQ